jgi:hypothetical protein
MIPHERSLVTRLEGRPFTLLGINSDRELDTVKKKNVELDVTWRNCWDPKNLIAKRWNVRAWPSLYLIDHDGVVRRRWFGDPGAEIMDREIDALVALAEAAGKRKR